MNSVEDRLRAAAREAAGTVPPGSAPPLHLPGPELRAPRLAAWPGRRPADLAPGRGGVSRRMLAPAAAAAAVGAVVIAAMVIGGGTPGPGTAGTSGGPAMPSAASGAAPGPARGTASSAKPGTTPPALSPAARAALASVPPYYVGLTGYSSERQRAVVRATVSGSVLATVTPPRPYGTFTWVTAAADGRTFVLAAQPWRAAGDLEPTVFFQLRLNAAGRPAGLTALPIPAEPSRAWVDGIALSPDASRLAVAVDQAIPEVNPKVEVFTLATGAVREWEWRGNGWIGNNKPIGSPLSWAADGRTLAFQITPANGTIEVRLLDTATPGGNLQSSALALEWTKGEVVGAHGVVITGSRTDPGDSLDGYNALLTPDGARIVSVTDLNGSPAMTTEFSVSTGWIAGLLGAQELGSTVSTVRPVQDVLWSGTTGSTVVVLTSSYGAAVLSGNQFTPIPGSSQLTDDTAW